MSTVSPPAALSPQDVIRRAPELVSPPEVFSKLMTALDQAEKGSLPLFEISHVIEHDSALSARLLKIVNSAFYGMPRTILSIEQALNIIGLRELRNLIIATVVVQRFSDLPNALMTMRQFWQTSVRCGIWAKTLGNGLVSEPGLGKDALFLCGLLHDIGRLVVYRLFPEASRAACLRAQAGESSELDAIRAAIGFDYYAVAAELSRAWRLPELLAITQQYHTVPQQAPSYQRETVIVSLASRLSMLSLPGPITGEALTLMQHVGLRDEQLAIVHGDVEQQFGEAIQLYLGDG